MSKFRQAAAKSAKEHWSKARTAEAGGRITLPPGQYVGLLTFTGDVLTEGKLKGVPKLTETITVTDGRHKGSEVSKGFLLGGDYAERAWEGLAKHLKAAFPEDKQEIAEFDEDGLLDFVDDLIESKDDYLVTFSVIETEMDKRDDKGKPTGEKETIKYFAIDGPTDGSTGDEEEEEEEEEDPPTKRGGKKAAPAEEEAEEEEAKDDEEGDEVQKGDTVSYKPPKARRPQEYVVVSINQKTHTATLKDDNGDKITAPLGDCDLVATAE